MNKTSLANYGLLQDATGIEEYQRATLYGMECIYCRSPKVQASYILVYEESNTLSQLIADEKMFASFNHDLYIQDIKVNRRYGEVYIIFVIPKDTTDIPVQKIEANKTYARKYVFFHNEAITFINGVRTNVETGLSGDADPIHVWAEVLSRVGLTGCLTEIYFAKNVTNYLLGEDFDSKTIFDEQYDNGDSDRMPEIKWIKSLDTKGFRSFCFNDAKLFFGQVNLFYGANGAGKSSVLEAIEYALTSEIRRMNDFKVKLSLDTNPVVDVYNREAGIIHFSPKFANKNAKQIEKSWYGVPISRNRPTLNQNFARFNSFDSEAAYNFIHNTDSSSSSFSVAFGNLMFGENVVDYERKWKRYKLAFTDALNSILKRIPELEMSLAFNKDLLVNSVSGNLSADIETSIAKLRYKKTHELPKETIERYDRLVAELAMVAEILKPFDDLASYSGKTFADIQAQVENTKSRNKLLLTQKEKIIKETEAKSIKLKDIAAERLQLNKELEAANEVYSGLFTSECNLYSSDTILADKRNLDLFDKLSSRKYEIESRLHSIAMLKENAYVSSFFAGKRYSAIPTKEIEEAKSRKESIETQLASNEASYAQKKSLLSNREADLVEIKRLGIILSTSRTCPLCGHIYSDNSELIRLIDNSHIADPEMTILLDTIARQKEELNKYNLIINFNSLRESALNALSELSGLVSELDDYKLDLVRIAAFIDEEDELKGKLDEVNSRLETLEKQGFSFMDVANARNYRYFDSYYLEYDALKTRKKYSEWLSEKKDAASKTVEKAKTKLNNNDERRVSITDEISLLHLEGEKVDIQLQSISEQNTYTLENALNSIPEYFEVVPTASLVDWLTAFKLLQNKAKAELNRLQNDTDYGRAKSEIAKISSELDTSGKQKIRAESAIAAFDAMPPLSSFVEGSIRENIEKISKYFKWMHHSGEFADLGVDSDGIYAIRGYNDETVRTFEMSTGQRSAMALAVMLAFHTTAASAPQFLLLDEPLATMDDIQVLNVLDILKSLVQSGTQVFFTTANEQMIRLFKQAFVGTSFEYKEYEFVKRIGNTSVITEKSVNETHTIEELTMDDISLDFDQFNEIRRILASNQRKLSE